MEASLLGSTTFRSSQSLLLRLGWVWEKGNTNRRSGFIPRFLTINPVEIAAPHGVARSYSRLRRYQRTGEKPSLLQSAPKLSEA